MLILIIFLILLYMIHKEQFIQVQLKLYLIKNSEIFIILSKILVLLLVMLKSIKMLHV